jgi:ubiquinone/menaquinone biosynthesis C-methylase UbiE
VAKNLSLRIGESTTRIVDLCCGVGTSTRTLAEAFPKGISVTGIDTSSEMIAMAQFVTNHVKTMLQPLRWLVNMNQPSSGMTTRMLRSKVRQMSHSAASASNKIRKEIDVATRIHRHNHHHQKSSSHPMKNVMVHYQCKNAENTQLPPESIDLVTIMYAFHEIPYQGREKIIQEAYRLLRPGGTLAIVDICSKFDPPETMLLGEPYILEYKRNIHNQLHTVSGFHQPEHHDIVPGHVCMWTLQRTMHGTSGNRAASAAAASTMVSAAAAA